ncbi:MliC family protein [Mannheimia sp. AT1]|uniref:MliC family protein n=1 Tax=Mannheimia cairinae TaxID=3025936 RepID=A0ABT5MN05_9PAST|nr:MliC family protein [Mannheimia cairinae]MDD0823475.1 MliC family protein [Mannheimia cairinae]MDD0826917.1 MliC family protein [Mannheimia cairinae]
MDLFLKQYKPIYLLSAIVCISACTPRVTPVDQIQQIQKANKDKEVTQFVTKRVEHTSEITLYRCNNGKKVEVERQKKSPAGKKETVIVSFQGTSHQLSSAVTKDGRKYTNIRWTWHEMRNGKAFLSNNTKKTLAANCVKQ